MKRTVSASVKEDQTFPGLMAMETKFLLCIKDGGYPESLEPRKFYPVVEDADAGSEGMIRVIDESGEDYLYPASCFVEVRLPRAVEGQLKAA